MCHPFKNKSSFCQFYCYPFQNNSTLNQFYEVTLFGMVLILVRFNVIILLQVQLHGNDSLQNGTTLSQFYCYFILDNGVEPALSELCPNCSFLDLSNQPSGRRTMWPDWPGGDAGHRGHRNEASGVRALAKGSSHWMVFSLWNWCNKFQDLYQRSPKLILLHWHMLHCRENLNFQIFSNKMLKNYKTCVLNYTWS